ncbi:MAG: DPP IV N-terminal domain-containing protein [Candidatus Omnitrophica bacterium]|nr:DPP IV N-terminal domain-containing protein [Candidatus Omnitrophota bacterium]
MIILLCLLMLPWIMYFIFAYKGIIFSFFAKNSLKGKIVYSLRSASSIDIRSVDLPSGKKEKIYSFVPRDEDSHPGIFNSLSFSPKGNKIIFSKRGQSSDDYNEFKLFNMDINSLEINKFFNIKGISELYVSYSPDGKNIALIVQKPYDQGSLYVSNIDKPYSSLKMICNIRPANLRLSWSPDGDSISFVSDEYIRKRISARWRSETFAGKAFIINNDGTGLKQLKANSPVSWSPDGKLLLYRREDGYYISNKNQTQEYLFISYKRAPLSMLVEDPSFAVWSPDGRYIAYVKEIWPGGVGLGIFVVPLDNPGCEIQVSVEIYGVTEMVWVK